MFKTLKSRKRYTIIVAVLCIMAMLVGSLAYFTDRFSGSLSATAGSMDLTFTDISASKSGTNGITSPNEFAIDKSWENEALVSDGNILNPGDYFDLSYTVANTGNKSMDVRQLLTVTSSVPMTDAAKEYTLTVTGQNYDNTTVAGTLSDDKLSITYELDDIVLNGTGLAAETESGVTWTEQTYTVRLDFAASAKNAFQDSIVSVNYDAQAKQHRNTGDGLWADWASYETKLEKIVAPNLKVITQPNKTTYASGEDFDSSGMEVTFTDSEDSTEVVTNYTVVDGTALAVGQNFVNLSYEKAGKTYATTVPIKVSGISVTAQPTKTVYTAGDAFDATGMEITFTDVDGNTEVVASYTIADGASLTADQTAVTIVYTDSNSAEYKAFVPVTMINYTDFSVEINNHSKIGCTSSTTDLVIPETFYDADTDTWYRVTKISMSAFAYNTNLTSVVIPDSVTSINSHAFYGCSNLESVVIPDSVTYLGDNAFYNCTSLESVVIPASVTQIHEYTFCGCTSLESVVIPDSVTYLGDSAFYNCTSLASIKIPSSLINTRQLAFANCTNLASVTFGENCQLTTFGRWTFSGCTSLTSIGIVGSGASIEIPSSVTTFGLQVFQGCTGLTTVTIPSGVTTIGKWTFSGCTSLTSATFENPTGWTYSSSESFGSGTKVDVSVPSQNATYLTNDYLNYYWYRK